MAQWGAGSSTFNRMIGGSIPGFTSPKIAPVAGGGMLVTADVQVEPCLEIGESCNVKELRLVKRLEKPSTSRIE